MQTHLAGLASKSPPRLGRREGGKQKNGDAARLSDRELAVFTATGGGRGPTQIGRGLGIAVKTVETHQRRIKEKLEVRSAQALHERAQRWLVAQG